ncbi:hypothetical protein [Sulfurisphaera tokodaii]|uniref:Uncharacterized protein n=2 Tax=Sulfurisphaera tokodaii TaxID=111955 RepID=Q970B7_SULTO|nr:hypothetical protein [Sulfurisphaera tokodaii]BAB66756.1 hypothetical protein STK_16750 [Sulfurisphaera tokodaii str. 7]HII73092.1 hypothetical protein [Sulfurisphaera tokodaii]
MTKSIIKIDDKILIEINKKGISAILVNGEIKVGDYDGVEFKETKMKHEEFVKEIVDKVKEFLLKCNFIQSIVMSDMYYIKFHLGEREVIAFISEDGKITLNVEVELNEDLKEKLLLCVDEFKKLLKIS